MGIQEHEGKVFSTFLGLGFFICLMTYTQLGFQLLEAFVLSQTYHYPTSVLACIDRVTLWTVEEMAS